MQVRSDSHSQQPGYHGAKSIKQVAIDQVQEVIKERSDGKDQRELLVLSTTVCKKRKHTRRLGIMEF